MASMSAEDMKAALGIAPENLHQLRGLSFDQIHQKLSSQGSTSAAEPMVKNIDARPTASTLKICSACGVSNAADGCSLKVCAGCHEEYYCSRACQKSHWRSGGHKEVCRIRKEMGVRRGVVMEGAVQNDKTSNNRRTVPPASAEGAHFVWDANVWQHSRPRVESGGLVAVCLQGEMSMCTIRSLDADHSECAVLIEYVSPKHDRDMISIGLCTKKKGRIRDYWKYSENGSFMVSSAFAPVPYGETFGTGDVISVKLSGRALSFSKNGQELAVAVADMQPLSLQAYYVRIYLTNPFSSPLRSGNRPMRFAKACLVNI